LYNIRIIKTVEEYKLVEELWSSTNMLMREKVSLVNKIPTNTDSNTTIVGAFIDNELYGTLRFNIWEKMPFYSIGGLHIKSGIINRYDFSNPANPISYITDFILEKMEALGYYNWYYVRTLGKAYAKIQENNHDLLSQTQLGSRYRKDVEELLLPNARSNFQLHDNLVLNKTWARPIAIIKCSLDNKYRQNGNIFETEMKIIDASKNTTSS